ncbi:MAG TPA: class I SAM-dependent methyltransferase [Elusimicrobiales bacterium]|nr:class I SAM-dependent methyltransferase [Elusimicrobiales bacterium]
MDNDPGKLSDKGHWDSLYSGIKLPRLPDLAQHHSRACERFLEPYLEPRRGGSLLEVGCGASAWLPHFAGKYGLKASGLDYSEQGCKLAAENLRLQGFEPEGIFCADLAAFTPPRLYDAIFSYGVVEHFSDFNSVIGRMASWLAPGGVLLTLVPNFRGIYGPINRAVAPEILDMHVNISREMLRSANERAGLEVQRCGYVGVLSLAVVPWSKSRGVFASKAALSAVSYANAALSRLLNLTGGPGTALFSPYLMSAAWRKK